MKPTVSNTKCCQLVDWYSQGESHSVEVGGVCIVIRLVGRKGRRARIAITAPPGAKFSTPPGGNQCKESSGGI